jgi:PmbA protein
MEIQNIAEKALAQSKAQQVDKAMVTVSSTVAKEFNIEANKLTLLRTTFDQGVSIKSVIDHKQALSSGNQFSDDALSKVAKTSSEAAHASPQDPAYGFAPSQGQQSFSNGDLNADEEWMFESLQQLLKDRTDKFAKIIFEGAALKFIKSERVLMTSEGSLLKSQQGYYDFMAMFTAKDGSKSSSFNFTTYQVPSVQSKSSFQLMEKGHLSDLLEQLSGQLELKKVPEKFVGDVIITPHGLADFIGGWNSYLSGGMLLKENSLFKNKLGEQIASSNWTLTSNPLDSQFATRGFWTGDGYITKNETIIDKGVLKTYLLDHYSANKLGQKVSYSGGGFLKLTPGQAKLKDMIKSAKRGVLLGRFSAGNPSDNGEIAGVAKNSYYIEDGEIKYPISETMLSMNLASMLKDVQAISSETITTGHSELPWVQFSNVVVS